MSMIRNYARVKKSRCVLTIVTLPEIFHARLFASADGVSLSRFLMVSRLACG
jgi:hypothetical protein